MQLTDKKLLSSYIAHFSRHTFAEFVKELFKDKSNYYDVHSLAEAGEDVFCLPYLDSYGGSIHDVLLLHFPPLELFRPSDRLTIDDPTLMGKLAKIRNIYHGRTGHWGMVDPFLRKDDSLKAIKFISNLSGLQREEYEKTLIPAYRRLQRHCGIKKPRTFVGSCDSFGDLNPEGAQFALNKITHEYSEGLAISITSDSVNINNFISGRNLASGASPGTRNVYEPLILTRAIRNQRILEEFQKLLHEEPPESRLQEFVVAHYREIFGAKYDRIETELWLRCAGLDVSNQDRRLDVFMRNSIRNDWELFEIKRAIKLTSTYRDIPVFVGEVLNAIQQVRNYAQILSQDKVKKHLAEEGIEYFEPSLNLIIGRTPQIPHAQWRWLLNNMERDLRIFTFDEILTELRSRFTEHYTILEKLLRPD